MTFPSRWLVLAALGACTGGGAMSGGFDLSYPDNRPDDVSAVAATVASSATEPGPAMVVLTAAPPARGLTAFALPGGQRLWQTGASVDARPAIAGDVVVSHVDRAVVAWDAQNGRERWRLADRGYALIGAGGDAGLLALTLGPGGISRRQGVILAVDPRSGATRFEREVEQSLGTPTAAGGYLFVPWSGQYLSVFDVGRGEERARIRNLNDVLGRAEREGNVVYFGARVLYRFAPEATAGRREAGVTYALPREDLPGNPPLTTDGYQPAMAGVNARERVAVVFRPDPTQPGVRTTDGVLYAVFHRVVFALDAANGTVRWAHTHAADIAGSEPVRGGLVLVDERGTAAMLDAQGGNVVWRQTLGTPTAQAVLHLPLDFAPPRDGGEPAQSPAATLITAAGGTDTRLLPARVFAARALANIPGVEATRGLIDIASRRNYPQELRSAAGEALARRSDGVEAMLEALATHYDFVRQTNPPPVGFIARALANAHDRRGAALLVSHLQDPETAATELPPLVAALKELADPAAVPALLDFVRLYHADDGLVPPLTGGDPINDRSLPEQEAMNAAMEQAIQAVAQLGGPAEQRWLRALADDRNTLDPVRAALERALAPAGSAQSSAGSSAAEDTPTNPNLPPPRLTMEMIRDAMEPARERMMQCLVGLSSRPSQVRITFRYDSEGVITNAAVVPAQLQPCIGPIVNSVRLPPSQVGREIGNYYLLGGAL